MTANKEFIKQFFATKSEEPKVIRVGGKFGFNKLPKDTQKEIKDRLAEKDPIVKELSEKKAVGIKIDGREVTQEWADQLDLEKPEIKRDDGIEVRIVKKDEKPVISKEQLKVEAPKEEIKITEEELKKKLEYMGFIKFREWAKKKFKVTGRDGPGIIKDILSGKKELK